MPNSGKAAPQSDGELVRARPKTCSALGGAFAFIAFAGVGGGSRSGRRLRQSGFEFLPVKDQSGDNNGQPRSGNSHFVHVSGHITAPTFSQSLPAIQSSIRVDDTVFFGVWGFNVPAIALQPLSIISWANCFASASALNLRVARANLRSPSLRLGAMFER